MAQLTSIEKTTRQVTDIPTGSSNLVLRVPLTSGEVVQFTADRQFFSPRQIATSTSQVLGLPSQSVVEYTAGNIPVVKLPIGVSQIPTNQYYPLSVVSDVYINVPIDNFFKELADGFEIPEENPEFTTLRAQRDSAMQAALGLEDLAAAAAASKDTSKTRTKYDPIIIYPKSLKSDQQDCIKFSMLQYTPSELKSQGSSESKSRVVTVSSGVPKIASRDVLSTIVLPIPGGPTSKNAGVVRWNIHSLSCC